MYESIYFAVAAIHGLCAGILLGGFFAAVRHRRKYKRTWQWILFEDDKALNVVMWLMLVYHITGEYILSR